jgi:hypothetical protein
MAPNDPLHDDLRAAYARVLARRARKRRVASFGAVGAIAAVAAGLVGADAFDSSGTQAHAGGPGSPEDIRCLNDHGWPVGEGLAIDPSGAAPDPATIDAAVAACSDLEHRILDSLRPGDEALVDLAAQADRFAVCMREHGTDVGSPKVFRTRAGIGVTFPGANPVGAGDAYAACKSVMNAFG